MKHFLLKICMASCLVGIIDMKAAERGEQTRKKELRAVLDSVDYWRVELGKTKSAVSYKNQGSILAARRAGELYANALESLNKKYTPAEIKQAWLEKVQEKQIQDR